MLNIMKSDLYKSLHRPYLYVTTAILSALAIFYNFIHLINKAPLETALQGTLYFLTTPLFLVVLFADAIVAEENKNQTLKNTISFGINRTRLYLSKLFTTTLTMLISSAIVFGIFIASAFLFLRVREGCTTAFLQMYFLRIGTAAVTYIAALNMAVLLSCIISRNSLFVAFYFGLLIIPMLVFKFLGMNYPVFTYAEYVMLFSQDQMIRALTEPGLLMSLLISAVHIIVFTVLGIILFRKREI